MGLKISRKPGEGFSIYDEAGARLVRVTMVRGGREPELDVDAPRELRIKREACPMPSPSATLPRAA